MNLLYTMTRIHRVYYCLKGINVSVKFNASINDKSQNDSLNLRKVPLDAVTTGQIRSAPFFPFLLLYS